MTTCLIYPHENRLIQLTAVPHESRIDIDSTVLLRHAVPSMDMAEETIRRTDLMYPLSKTLTAIMTNLAGLTGLVQHPERRLMRDKHVHAGRDCLHINSFSQRKSELAPNHGHILTSLLRICENNFASYSIFAIFAVSLTNGLSYHEVQSVIRGTYRSRL